MTKLPGFLAQYRKFFTAIVGLTVTALEPTYGTAHWFIALVAAMGALGVWGVPNAAKPAAVTAAAVPVVPANAMAHEDTQP